MNRPSSTRQLQSSVVMGLQGLTSVQFTSLMPFLSCFPLFFLYNSRCIVSWSSHHFHTGCSCKHTRHDLGASTCVACPACGCVSDQAQLQWQNPRQHQTTLVDCEQVNYNQPNRIKYTCILFLHEMFWALSIESMRKCMVLYPTRLFLGTEPASATLDPKEMATTTSHLEKRKGDEQQWHPAKCK